MIFAKPFIFAWIAIVEFVVRIGTSNPVTHQIFLAPGIEPNRWTLGRWNTWRTFEKAAKKVPAYKEFLAQHDFPVKLHKAPGKTLAEKIHNIPVMDKENYIKQWTIPQRVYGGKLPHKGIMVDESSGSSGTPTSWVRGPSERRAVRRLLQVAYHQTLKSSDKPVFIINAFSLGAWATGMNITNSLLEVTTMKSTGPDRNKIINTMKEFGTDHTYVIMSYPPFLKSLFDDDRINWKDYDIITAFGGEGISENMRTYILNYAYSAYGSYGASDLEIDIAIETEFAIQIRKAIASNRKLAQEISKTHEYGVLPMVFQFNPYNYLMESNEKGELLVTITRQDNISPRLRYNIHDRGHVLRLSELEPILEKYGMGSLIKGAQLDFPLLFQYGRSDLSLDYNGAVVSPDTIRDIIYSDNELVNNVENHRLISYEDAKGDKQLHIALQLEKDVEKFDSNKYSEKIISEARKLNGDFNNAILTSADAMLPTIAFYRFRTGPFANDGAKLKNEYVATLTWDQVKEQNCDLSNRVAKQL